MLESLKKYASKNSFFWLIIILVFGFLLRLFASLKAGSFWFDEMFSVYSAQYDSLGDMWRFLIYENNPPLHNFILHFWINIFSASETAVRMPSLLFSVMSIGAIYVLGKKMFNERVGLIAAFFAGFTSFQIYYSVEARGYVLLQLLSIISLYFFWSLLKENKKTGWLWYFVFILFLVYTHLFAWVVVVAQGCFVFFLFLRKKVDKKFLFSWIVAALGTLTFFLVWFLPSIVHKLELNSLRGWYFYYGYERFSYFSVLTQFLTMANPLVVVEITIFFLSLVLLLSSLVNFSKEGQFLKLKLELNLANVFLFWFIFISLLPVFIFKLSLAKYYMFLAPAFYLLLSYGLSKLSLGKQAKRLIIIFLLACFLSSSAVYLSEVRGRWDKVAEFIEKKERPGDLIINHVFAEALILKNYYQGDAPIIGFYPIDDDYPEEIRIIKKNWQPIVNEQNVEKLNELTKGYQRVFLVYNCPAALDQGNYVFGWFLKNPWVLEEEKSFNGFGNPQVIIFSKAGLKQ